jgi:hypothetical protein
MSSRKRPGSKQKSGPDKDVASEEVDSSAESPSKEAKVDDGSKESQTEFVASSLERLVVDLLEKELRVADETDASPITNRS